MMRYVVSLIAAVGLTLASSSALAAVTISHDLIAGATEIVPGDQITVGVSIAWDGDGALNGVFYSTMFDDSVFALVDVSIDDGLGGRADRTGSVFGAFIPPATIIPGLASVGGLNQPGDPGNIIRTVQYAGLDNANPAGAFGGAAIPVTEITLQAIAPGVGSIGALLAPGDSPIAFSASGSTEPAPDLAFGPGVTINVIPEPGTALLMGLGLAGLAAAGRRRE